MQGIVLIILLATVAWYWWNSMQSKELARQAGKHACERTGVQFLDDTVAKKKIWLRRNPQGRLELCRIFFFEFATDGEHRYEGRIVVLGKTVADVSMDAYRIS